MRIFYVSGYTRMVLFNKLIPGALRKNGYEVIEFDWNSVLKYNKIFNIYSREKIETKINQVLLKNGIESNPDFIFVLKGEPVFLSTLQKIKEKTSAVLFNFFGDDPWEFSQFSGKVAPFYDFFFTYDPWSVKLYRKNGHKHAYHLPYGYDPEIGNKLKITNSDIKKYGCDITFIGSHYPKREELLNKLKYNYNIKIWGRGWKNTSCKDVFQGKALYGYEMLKAMRCGKILLNIHKGFEQGVEESGEGLNLRVMEGTACKSFQICNYQADIPKRFHPEVEIVLYHTWDEALEKINHYLKNESKRKEIAEKGYNRLVREHTLQRRMGEMMNVIRENI